MLKLPFTKKAAVVIQDNKKRKKVQQYRQVIKCFFYQAMKAYNRLQTKKLIERAVTRLAVLRYYQMVTKKNMAEEMRLKRDLR